MPEVAGVTHRYVETGRLGVRVAEAGSGPLLLHGWPQHWYAWRELIPLLAGSRRLICPDLCGFGWTDIQVIPVARHLLAEECPQAVATAVSAFLR
jgi:pimeloyl-ACP methyl ester carboxylesterase